MDMKKVDEIIERHQAEKGPLIAILHDIQAEERYLPEEALTYLSKKLYMPLSKIFRVATYFEKAFSLRPKAKHTVKVCRGTTCHVKNSEKILTEVEKELDEDGVEYFNLEKVRCLGCCASAPNIEIDGEVLNLEAAKSTILKLKSEK